MASAAGEASCPPAADPTARSLRSVLGENANVFLTPNHNACAAMFCLALSPGVVCLSFPLPKLAAFRASATGGGCRR